MVEDLPKLWIAQMPRQPNQIQQGLDFPHASRNPEAPNAVHEALYFGPRPATPESGHPTSDAFRVTAAPSPRFPGDHRPRSDRTGVPAELLPQCDRKYKTGFIQMYRSMISGCFPAVLVALNRMLAHIPGWQRDYGGARAITSRSRNTFVIVGVHGRLIADCRRDVPQLSAEQISSFFQQFGAWQDKLCGKLPAQGKF